MAATAAHVVPVTAPAPPAPRPRVVLAGTAFVAAGCVMAMAGLIGMYLAARADALATTGIWLPEGSQIPLTPGTMALFTLLISVVSMQWSVYAVGNNDRLHALLALGLTLLFGFCFVNSTTFLYTQMELGVADSAAAVLIYVVTGAHLAMVIGSMVFTALMTLRTVGGDYSARDREGIVAAALFWYVTIAVYAVIWYAIYVTK